MAHTMRKYFKQLVKKHLEFESTPTAAGRRKKRKKTDDEESDYEANQEEEPVCFTDMAYTYVDTRLVVMILPVYISPL